MTDLEALRRARVREINTNPRAREVLQTEYGQVWDTTQLAKEFEVLGFAAPFVVVRRKSDRMLGSLEFQHSPRVYFNFMPHRSS